MEIDDDEPCKHAQKKQNRAMAGQAEIGRCSHESPPFLLQHNVSTIQETVCALRNRARKGF
jgi:hypothetical protein